MCRVDPSGFVSKVIGRMPASSLSCHTLVSRRRVDDADEPVCTDPDTANLPSGVT